MALPTLEGSICGHGHTIVFITKKTHSLSISFKDEPHFRPVCMCTEQILRLPTTQSDIIISFLYLQPCYVLNQYRAFLYRPPPLGLTFPESLTLYCVVSACLCTEQGKMISPLCSLNIPVFHCIHQGVSECETYDKIFCHKRPLC